MKLKTLRGYVLAFVSLAVLTLAAVLLLNNIGGQWEMQVIYRPVILRPAAWLLLAGAGGVVIFGTVAKLAPRAIKDLRAGVAARRARSGNRKAKPSESQQKRPEQ